MSATAKNRVNGTAKPDQAVSTTSIQKETTDRSRWRMSDDKGRHIWHYLESDEELKSWPQSKAEKYYMGLETVWLPRSTPHLRLSHHPAFQAIAAVLRMLISSLGSS